MSEYLPAAKVYKLYAIARARLSTWAETGKVEDLLANGGGKRLYKFTDIKHVLGVDSAKKTEEARQHVCYARINSTHQRADSDTQVAFVSTHYPTHRDYRDVGCGLNFKRPQFVALLDGVHTGTVDETVVTDKNRLCRVASDLVQ